MNTHTLIDKQLKNHVPGTSAICFKFDGGPWVMFHSTDNYLTKESAGGGGVSKHSDDVRDSRAKYCEGRCTVMELMMTMTTRELSLS